MPDLAKQEYPMNKAAQISECGLYRYTLHRCWGNPLAHGKTCEWIMLNPSTADHEIDDPTIRRCISFAKQWDCDRIRVLNLFALRTPDPKHLKTATDPIGPENDEIIKHFAFWERAWITVFAWGTNGRLFKRSGKIARWFPDAYCLGKTKDGHPKHPLYVKNDTELVLFR
jgi:hypothetical protein